MPHFAVRQDLDRAMIEDVRKLTEAANTDSFRLRGAYWAPERGRLLSIYEGDGEAGPGAPAGHAEVQRVLPITAEEYGPPGEEPLAGNGDGLQLVLVRRQLDPMTQREFRAIALQAIMCAYEYTEMRWLRSFWATERNELHCLFRSRTHELVREHAYRSRIPCDEVDDAIEITTPLT